MSHKHQLFLFLSILLTILLTDIFLFSLLAGQLDALAFILLALIPILTGWLLGMRMGIIFGGLCAFMPIIIGFQTNSFSGIILGTAVIIRGMVSGRLKELIDRVYKENEGIKTLKDENRKIHSQLDQARKMESIGILAGGIAHDFNNILAAIMGHVEIAQLNTSSDHPLYQNLTQILQATYRAKDLVQQILTFCRQTEDQMQPVQFNQVIKEVLRLLRASLPSTVEIRSNIENGTGVVLADPTRIHQVLMNLCTNSLHSMEEKGGTLEISLADIEIESGGIDHVDGLRPGQYVQLSVNDTGHGIDPAIMNKIFDPYFTTKAKGKGTGMGLTVVNEIIKNHHGAIQVLSQVDEGTTFHLYFPRVEAEVVAEVQVPEQAPTGNERILFVDDEKDLVDMVKRILEHLGYQTLARTDSIEALETFRELPNDFDLIITDMTMPNMTGDILSEEIKKIRSDIPIILCSGFSPLINKEKAQNLGIKNILMKPLAINDLAKAVRNALDTP
ncbi:MAG: response regulator [Deltaproteobacteria bacterium]|nr:response regulator [Deltaproteobacteria bacterium]